MTFFWAPKKRLVFTLGEVIVHSPSLWRMWYVLLSKCLKRRTHDGTAFLPLQGATFKNTFNAFFSFFFFGWNLKEIWRDPVGGGGGGGGGWGGGGGGGWGLSSLWYCWWPIYHISALQCFGSHEGGSLNCPKTAPGWRLFPPLSAGRQDTRAIYRTSRGAKTSNNLLVNIFYYYYYERFLFLPLKKKSLVSISIHNSVCVFFFFSSMAAWAGIFEGAGCVLSDE